MQETGAFNLSGSLATNSALPEEEAQIAISMRRRHCVTLLVLAHVTTLVSAKVSFEKLTNLDFAGSAYYTIRNLSLYECQGWCRDEKECVAAAFSFVLNPLAPQQETTCLLQNSTQARKPTARPQRAVNLYYLVKNHIRSEKICDRLWSFERFPNKMVRGHDTAVLFTASKDSCLAACLNEDRFVCRSAEFNYVTLQCHLSDVDRRYAGVQEKYGDAIGVDYFENACLEGCPPFFLTSYSFGSLAATCDCATADGLVARLRRSCAQAFSSKN
ncbi:hypothetical protein HPB49_022810 [Dermacentor silvarum]|uniref:Uncharacterized protein n=1 Tax=Dermacentor silvarum TaxID=543639 RepID=A0ACB8E3R4_DERSI|nr:hypothetical protein HPB49_022810 [Dermacentor silvarum]